jgi:chromate transporter
MSQGAAGGFGADSTRQSVRPSSGTSVVSIFISFLRLGSVAFGGPAMVAYIKDLAVSKKHWLSGDTFGAGIALCQTIPGATAMQSAAYVGLKTRRAAGAAAAYIGFGLPAFLYMFGLAVLYRYGQNAPLVLSLLSGLRAVVVAIVANAAINFGRTTIKNWWAFLVAGAVAAALLYGVSPIYLILGAAVLGLVLPFRQTLQTPGASGGLVESRRGPYLRPLLVLVVLAALGVGLLCVFDRPLAGLALVMLRIDLFAFGGGLASVPLMQHEFVDVHHWVSAKVFIDGIALGQITPGPIVITATFVGYMFLGIAGAVVATIAIFLPSFGVLVLVEPYFSRLRRNRYFNKAVAGILLSFIGLLAALTVRLGLGVTWGVTTVLLALVAFVALRLKVSVVWVVLGAGILSLLLGLI